MEFYQKLKSNRLPVILQSESSECGIACLCMLLNYFGHRIDLHTLRKKLGTGSLGTTLKDITSYAETFGLECRSVRIEPEDIRHLKQPSLLHWNMNHFIVVKRITKNGIIAHDPSNGTVFYTNQEIERCFTGVAVEFFPKTSFIKKDEYKKLNFSDLLKSFKGILKNFTNIFLLSVLIQIFILLIPIGGQIIIDEILVGRDVDYAILVLVFLSGILALKLATKYLRAIAVAYLRNLISYELSSTLFSHLISLPMSYFQRRKAADILTRFNSVEIIKDMMANTIVMTIVDGMLLIIAVAIMFMYTVPLTLLIVFLTLVTFLSQYYLLARIKLQTSELLISRADQSSSFIETLRAIKTIKLYGKEDLRKTIWQNKYGDQVRSTMDVDRTKAGMELVVDIISAVTEIATISILIYFVLNNIFTLGMMVAYRAFKEHLTMGFTTLVNSVRDFKMLEANLDRISDIAYEQPETEEQDHFDLQTYDIEFRDIFFKYSQNDPFVLENINLKILQGTSIAIIGPSGSGKSTLISLLMGLNEQHSGDLLIGDKRLTDNYKRSFRRNIATVTQDDTLISGSILENITFFDEKPDMNRATSAAFTASILLFITSLPMGMHTLIGDMGSSLSGGQKQRIILARALYQQPKILILDEATSHLDIENERIINRTIKGLNITRIVVAHRIETITACESIFRLEDKKLIDVTKEYEQHKQRFENENVNEVKEYAFTRKFTGEISTT